METFITFIVSALITFLVTWYFTKKQMKRNEICHFSINSYDVGKGLQDIFSNFRLTYDNKEFENEVQVLKGGFVNIGRNDITGLENNSDIKMILPEGCRLKEIKIEQLSEELSVNACSDATTPNVINIGIDKKIMSGEGFKYTALIESTEVIKKLHSKIKFKHRIPNASKTIMNEFVGQQTQPKGLVWILVFSLIMGIFFWCCSFSCFFAQNVEYKIKEKKTEKELSLYETPQSQLYVSDNFWIPYFDKKSISKEELDRNYVAFPKTGFSWGSVGSITGYITALFALLYLVLTFYGFYLWNRKKRLYHLLEQFEQE